MLPKKFWNIAISAVVVLTTAVAVISCALGNEYKLVLSDAESGKKYAEFEMIENEEFSVSFIHSVNLTEVTDCYYAEGDYIVCDKCIYSSFGAGMPTEWDESWSVSYEDERITLTGLNIRQKEVTYIVGTVYDHILHINGQDIVLNEICGKNTKVTLKIKAPLFSGD